MQGYPFGFRFARRPFPKIRIPTGERHQEIVFKSTDAEPAGPGRWTLRGNLTLRGQTRPVTVHVTLKDGRYTGETIVKQTDYGIKPPGKAGVRAKDEVRVEFDVRLAS